MYQKAVRTLRTVFAESFIVQASLILHVFWIKCGVKLSCDRGLALQVRTFPHVPAKASTGCLLHCAGWAENKKQLVAGLKRADEILSSSRDSLLWEGWE